MKKIKILAGIALLINQYALPINLKVPDWVKMPARATTVVGDAPKSYSIVYTKITKDPADQEGTPVVVRTVKSTKNAGAGSAPVNEDLTIPQADIILNAGILPDAVSKIAGFIDPRAGAAAKEGSAILDESLNIAGQELTKKYKLNAFEIKLIELLPTEYYYIDNTDNSVKVKDSFLTDLEKYIQILTNYQNVVDQYNPVAIQG